MVPRIDGGVPEVPGNQDEENRRQDGRALPREEAGGEEDGYDGQPGEGRRQERGDLVEYPVTVLPEPDRPGEESDGEVVQGRPRAFRAERIGHVGVDGGDPGKRVEDDVGPPEVVIGVGLAEDDIAGLKRRRPRGQTDRERDQGKAPGEGPLLPGDGRGRPGKVRGLFSPRAEKRGGAPGKQGAPPYAGHQVYQGVTVFHRVSVAPGPVMKNPLLWHRTARADVQRVTLPVDDFMR